MADNPIPPFDGGTGVNNGTDTLTWTGGNLSWALSGNCNVNLPSGSVTLPSGTIPSSSGTGATGTWPISISGNSSTVTTNANLTGDVTSVGNSTTLATVNSSPGTFGDGTHVTQLTVNAKGLVTAASSVAITGASPTGSASGDLSGTYPSPTVAKINGVTLGSTTATSGNLLIGSGTAWVTNAIGGDATLGSTGSLTVTKTSGVAFAASATTDTTNAANISSGTLPTGRLSGAYNSITGVGTLTQNLNVQSTGTLQVFVGSTTTGSINGGDFIANRGDQAHGAAQLIFQTAGSSNWSWGTSPGSTHLQVFDFANSVTTIDVTPGATNTSLVTFAGNLNVGGLTASDLTGTDASKNIVSGSLTGDVTTSAFAATIAAGAVTLAKMANLAANSIIGNNTGSSATPIALTASQTKTLLSLNNVENTALSTWAGTTNITTLGTITAGTWTGTSINADNINFSSTNLKNTSHSLNTIQDITTSSTPQFSGLNLGTASSKGNLTISGAGGTSISGILSYFGSVGAATATNLYYSQIDKNGTEGFLYGINKSTSTGSIPGNGVFISTYTSSGTISIGRGAGTGLPNNQDISIDGSGNVGINNGNLNVTNLTASKLVATDASKNFTSATTALNPQFASLGLGTAAPTTFALNLQAPDSTQGLMQFITNAGSTKWLMKLQDTSNADLGFTEAGVADNRLVLVAGGNISINSTGSFGGGTGVVFIANRSAAPSTNPSGGGILYTESGALKYRGSSGTVTTIANA